MLVTNFRANVLCYTQDSVSINTKCVLVMLCSLLRLSRCSNNLGSSIMQFVANSIVVSDAAQDATLDN